MGKAYTKVKSPLRDYNLETRVHKLLENEKPTPAPRHEVSERYQAVIEEQRQQRLKAASTRPETAATAEMIRKMALEATDEELAEGPSSDLLRKNDSLLERMDQIKITSQGDNPDVKSARKLPEDRGRSNLQLSIYGQTEPAKIPIGRMSMKQVVESLVDYSKDREAWTAPRIANTYRIDAEKARNLTHYYQVFDIHLPSSAVADHRARNISASNYEETKREMLSDR